MCAHITVVMDPLITGLQKQRQGAREALALAIRCYNEQNASPISGVLDKTAHGQPVLRSLEGHVSLSHKPGIVSGALALRPIGIDIERVQERASTRLWGEVASPEEWLTCEPGWTSFYRLWTGKEAVLKAIGLGLGLRQGLRDCRVQEVQEHGWWFSHGTTRWIVRYRSFGTYLLAIALPDPAEVLYVKVHDTTQAISHTPSACLSG